MFPRTFRSNSIDVLIFSCFKEGHKNVTLENILKMRKNENRACKFFYDCILRCVVGKIEWKRLIRQNIPISAVNGEDFEMGPSGYK